MTTDTWMVHAGEGATLAEGFEEKSCVAIGWRELGDLSGVKSCEEISRAIAAAYPDWEQRKQRTSVSQVDAFLFDFQVGDRVLTYNREQRVYLVGQIVGGYEYRPELVEGMPHIHKVSWQGGVSRDDLFDSTKSSLGSPHQTLFRVGEGAVSEIEDRLAGRTLAQPPARRPPGTRPEGRMTMSRDVDDAFDALVEELGRHKDHIAEEVAAVIQASRYEEACDSITRAKEIGAIIGAVADLQERWAALAGKAVPGGGPGEGETGDADEYRECVLRVLVSLGGSARREDVLGRVEGEAKKRVLPGAYRQDRKWRALAEHTYDQMSEEGLVLGASSDDVWAITDAGRKWLAEQPQED